MAGDPRVRATHRPRGWGGGGGVPILMGVHWEAPEGSLHREETD